MGSSFGTDDYFMETDDEMEEEIDDGEHKRQEAFLIVPQVRKSTRQIQIIFIIIPFQRQESRRSSAMTCCSTESSYLERRGSAYTLGLGSVPPSLRRKLSSASRTSSTENWDYYYPGIHIIRATPNTSPCSSEKRGRHGSPVPSRHARLRKQSTIGKGFSNSSYDAEAGMSSYFPPPEPSTSKKNGAIPKIPKTPIAPSMSYQQFQVNEKPTVTATTASTTIPASSSHRLSFRKKKSLGSLTSIADDLPEELTVSSIPSVPIKRAPLASLSSFKISSLDYQDSENRSVDYDSLFMDSIPDDTDHEIDGFSTDSEDVCGVDGSCRQFTTVIVNQADSSVAPVTTTITASTAADDKNIKFSKKLDIGKCSSRLFGSSSFKLRTSRRPTLERHKTISSAYSSSTDQILIVGQEELLPMKTLNVTANTKPTEVSTTFIQGTTTATLSSTVATTTTTTLPPQPQQLLSSSRLGNLNDENIPTITPAATTSAAAAASSTCIQMANLSPQLGLGAKRKPLKTQVSDTPSIPTNTDDTTPETCSITLHTEIIQELPPAAAPVMSADISAVVLSVRRKSCSCSDLKEECVLKDCSQGFCSCKEDCVVSEKASYSKAIMIEMPVIKRQNTSDDVVEVMDEDENEGDDFEYADENSDQDPYSKETLF
ncbi:hypothetical protein ACFFRR_003816 [Megaselia abdita]